MGFNYEGFINDMSEEAFEFLKSKLWTLLDFKVLNLEDVRKIDLLERIYTLRNKWFSIIKIKDDQEINHYYEQCDLYFNEFLKCVDESRSKKYYSRAKELIKDKCNNDADDHRTLVMIYVSLIRGKYNSSVGGFEALEDKLKRLLSRNDIFCVQKDDMDILEKIRTNGKIYPSKYDRQVRKAEGRALVRAEKNLFHLINVIFLVNALDDAKVFDEVQTDE